MKLFRSPLARAKGSGVSGEGAAHFWVQRLTALALIPLVLWLNFSLIRFPGADFHALAQWIGAPLNAFLCILFLSTALWHGQLGMETIMEDYIQNPAIRMTAIIMLKLLAFGAMAAGIFILLMHALRAS